MKNKIFALLPIVLLASSCCNFSTYDLHTYYSMENFLSIGDTKTINIDAYRTNSNQEVDFTYEIDKYSDKSSDTYSPCINVKKDDKIIFVTAIKEGQSCLSIIINDNSRYGISFQFYIRSGD